MMRQAWQYFQEQPASATVRMGIMVAVCLIGLFVYTALSKFVDFALAPFDSRIPGLGLVVVASAVTVLTLAAVDWRRALWFLMFWLVIEDILRRLLPGQPPQLMLVADIIVAGIYIGYSLETVMFRRHSRMRWPFGFLLTLIIFAVVSILGMFNPALPSFWFGFVGLHSYAWFLPLIFVGSTFSHDSRNSSNLMLFVSMSCIPLFSLAVYQYFHFGTLPAALQSLHGDLDYHSFGNYAVPLISSAFGNAEKYARYCALGLFFSLAMLADLQLSVRRRILAIMSACASLGGIFVSDRRTPLYLCLVGLAIVVWKVRYVFRSATLWGSLLLLCLIAGLAHQKRSQEISSSSEYFVSSVPEIQDRVNFLLDEITVVANGAGVFGRGTGADSQGLNYVPGGVPLATANGATIENGLTKVWWELGPFGLVSFLLFWATAGLLLFKKAFRDRNTRLYSYALCYATYFCIMFVWFAKGHQIMGDVATGIDQWLFFGMIAGLPSALSSKNVPSLVRNRREHLLSCHPNINKPIKIRATAATR